MRTLQAFLLRSSLLVAALMGPSTACLSAQNSAPALTLQGTVTRADFMHYRELPFTVPAGVTRVSAELSYTDKDKRTSIDLGAIDNERFRGWSGGNKSYFTISESDATASYLPGPVRPGVWKILLGIPSIREGVTSSYEVKIWFGHDGDPTDVSTFSREPMKPGPAWFRGDLHMHDGHSDGSCAAQSGKRVPCPLYRSVEAAAKRNLDFIAITDHNTTAHYDAMRELQPAFDQLLLIPGREITTFFGHMNVFGTSAPIDFRLSDTMPDFKTLLDRIDKLHAIVSVNHPASPTGESCMGCGWSVPNTDWSRIPAIEAVNGGNTGNRGGIPFWDDKLNLGNAKGFHLTGIGGGDNHFVDYLVAEGYRHVTVLDLSAAALDRAKACLGEQAKYVQWVVGDVLRFHPAPGIYDVWHDRATFHFFTTAAEIAAYLAVAEQAVPTTGYLMVGTLSTHGPASYRVACR